MQEINIKTIPHKKQRYSTCGDFFNNKKKLEVRISDTGNPDYDFFIAMHELIEHFFSQKHGISIKEIDKWDINFKGEGEPGDAEGCPYREWHQLATFIERILVHEAGYSWEEYEKVIDSL